jgi:hypothetical protein
VVRHVGVRLPDMVERAAAMLTGWLDRASRDARRMGAAGGCDTDHRKTHQCWRLVIITSHGSSRLINLLEGETGRSIIGRSVRCCATAFARTTWRCTTSTDRRRPNDAFSIAPTIVTVCSQSLRLCLSVERGDHLDVVRLWERSCTVDGCADTPPRAVRPRANETGSQLTSTIRRYSAGQDRYAWRPRPVRDGRR